MSGYVAFGDDDKPGDLTPRVSENVDKPGLMKKARDAYRSLSPTTSSGRRKLASRSFVGPLSPKPRSPGIYDTNEVNLPTISQWELDNRDKRTADIRAEKAQEMAREAYGKELKEIKEKEKKEKKLKSKCNSELRGCYMNCKAPGYRSKHDCDKCTDKIFDRVNAGKSACDGNTVSHYKADCDKHCREGGHTTQMKAKMGNKKAQEELKKREGSYGDNLPRDNIDRKRSEFIVPRLGKGAAQDRIRLIDRPDGIDALGNFRIPELRKPVVWGDETEYATGGARRRRRTKRRKPKKSKKSKRTRRTRRQRR